MNNREKIPKIIHYVWFGENSLSELAQKCLESWKKYCPDYEIVCWNESNFDIEYNDFVKEAYNEKKWAFVSDVVRLYALVNYGGIYMDTDVEVIKSLDSLLSYDAVSGFESPVQIQTGLMACKKGHPFFKELLHDYDRKHFIKNDGTYDDVANVIAITKMALKYGLVQNNQLQTVKGFTLLPRDYLCPLNYETRELNITENTYCIHYFSGSWMTEEQKCRIKLQGKYVKTMPRSMANALAGFVSSVRFNGITSSIKKTCKWVKKRIVNVD